MNISHDSGLVRKLLLLSQKDLVKELGVSFAVFIM